ncbi:uncharacterized protein IL334_004291 [Kwoniella shivajii]|uniref:Translation initiation factor 4E n=1 Tax=Kwoniella shivajii TaxID=564305 RepID=A0ABZ1D0B4_9TREE|nr:hypothetical protein IL334_004291 [Kwoniella shivajii]
MSFSSSSSSSSSPPDTETPNSPDSPDPISSDTFLSSAYRNLSNDPDKLQRLLSNVSTHAFAEQFPAFQGQWMLTEYNGQIQYIRIDNLGNLATVASPTSTKKAEGIRGRLKSHYPSSFTKHRLIAGKETEEHSQTVTDTRDIDRVTASIEEINVSTSGKKKKRNKKRKGKKIVNLMEEAISLAEKEDKHKEEEDDRQKDEDEQSEDQEEVEVVLSDQKEELHKSEEVNFSNICTTEQSRATIQSSFSTPSHHHTIGEQLVIEEDSPPHPQIQNNIIYFGDIPTYIVPPDSEEIEEPHDENQNLITELEGEHLVTPTSTTLNKLSYTATPFIPRHIPNMSNLTPPQSPPTQGEDFQCSDSQPQVILTTFNSGERPLTPPSEAEEEVDEKDDSLVFPSNKVQEETIIPSITVDTPTSPSLNIHPLTHSWTLHFSDTSKSRQRKVTVPTPLGTQPNAADYSSHLVTLFNASSLEDLFGAWKALRRAIANSKKRIIELLGDSSLRGGPGLGTFLFPDETNFHFFKAGIKPMWEDKMCQKGGKIMIAGEAQAMDKLFLDAILMLISGDIDDNCPPPPGMDCQICGIVLSRRKLTRMEIWVGGTTVPEQGWINDITTFIEDKFQGFKVYGYKSFGKH